MRNGETLWSHIRAARARDIGVQRMPKMHEPLMERDEANKMLWKPFKEKLFVLTEVAIPGGDIECIFVPKMVNYSAEDVCTFVGGEKKDIFELDDFSLDEGKAWFDINFGVAQELVSEKRPEVQVNIGFNPQEFTKGHHTVARLHSHIRTVGHPMDVEKREQRDWKDLKWFDRLTSTEPFAVLHHDFIAAFAERGSFGNLLDDLPKAEHGYTELLLKKSELSSAFGTLQDLYSAMKQEYASIEAVFTDKVLDPQTGRYAPRAMEERKNRLDDYLENNSWLSPQSVDVLGYIAENIKIAQQKGDEKEIVNAATAHITRGFAGAFTFTFGLDQDTVRLDFLPHVITTSCLSKTISGKGMTTIIEKGAIAPREKDRETIKEYHQEVLQIARNLDPK